MVALTSIAERTLARPSFTEHYVTVVGPPAVPAAQAARAVFDALADAVSRHGILPVQEKIYGPSAERDAIGQVRQQALEAARLDPHRPYAYTDGRAGEDRGPLSAQLWGVVPVERHDVAVTTVELRGGPRGRLLEGAGLRLLWLAGIVGTLEDGRLADGASQQAEQMFTNADAALREAGFSYHDVARTWIHLRRLLDWYGELNRVRTAFHASRGIAGAPGARPLPASTGIQGTRGGEECVMDLLAARPRDGSWTVRPLLRSNRQREPLAYGSGFSRGMALCHGDADTIFVSGTASIGPDGESRHADDPDAQVTETLLSVAALLEPAGGGLQDLATGVLYYKDALTRHAYERVARERPLPDLPLVPVLADVCRPELLVEIEAVALVPARASVSAGGGA